FDLVFFGSVLQYMDDDVVSTCLAKAKTLLAPGGCVVSRDSVQLVTRIERAGEYPVIYRTPQEYFKLFSARGLRCVHMEVSFVRKRFTNLTERLYGTLKVPYGLAYAFRESLIFLDGLLGRPVFLKPKKYLEELKIENP